jgi:hypothetical protein
LSGGVSAVNARQSPADGPARSFLADQYNHAKSLASLMLGDENSAAESPQDDRCMDDPLEKLADLGTG